MSADARNKSSLGKYERLAEPVERGSFRSLLFRITTWRMHRELTRSRADVDKVIKALEAKGICGPNAKELADRLLAIGNVADRLAKLPGAKPSLPGTHLAIARVVSDATAEAVEAQAVSVGDPETLALAIRYRRASQKADQLAEELVRRGS